MLKIFSDLTHYQSEDRSYLADLLRPFVPKDRFKEFGLDCIPIKLVKSIEKCDLCLLPMAWNYYLDQNKIQLADYLWEKQIQIIVKH